MKRLTLNRIDEFIHLLESTEYVDGRSEEQKKCAIAYLNNYAIRLEELRMKSVLLKQDEDFPRNNGQSGAHTLERGD